MHACQKKNYHFLYTLMNLFCKNEEKFLQTTSIFHSQLSSLSITYLTFSPIISYFNSLYRILHLFPDSPPASFVNSPLHNHFPVPNLSYPPLSVLFRSPSPRVPSPLSKTQKVLYNYFFIYFNVS